MQLETKYLRLCTAVTLGSRFGDWRVCWRGGWSRHRLFYLRSRIIELVYTASDLRAFASRNGYDAAPLRWDDERRFLIRCELDALYFQLYGITREEAAYIIDTFLIVRRKDEQQFGEYRTKRVILEIYNALAEAARSGIPYATRLDPPPADPRVATESCELKDVPPTLKLV